MLGKRGGSRWPPLLAFWSRMGKWRQRAQRYGSLNSIYILLRLTSLIAFLFGQSLGFRYELALELYSRGWNVYAGCLRAESVATLTTKLMASLHPPTHIHLQDVCSCPGWCQCVVADKERTRGGSSNVPARAYRLLLVSFSSPSSWQEKVK